ncbi:MAG: TIGR03936 family radical SAM-associated protein, partial [bacterium]
DVDHSWLEAILSRGDRRLGKAIKLAYGRGCRFDAWTDQFKIEVWRQVFVDLEMDTEKWLKDIPLYAPLPWDHLDSRVKKEFLVRELKRALKGRFSPACEKPYKKRNDTNRTDLGRPEENDKLVCYHCGLNCDLEAIRKERIDSWQSLGNEIPVEIQTIDERFLNAPKEITRYRAAYCKLGAFRFLSALDLNRMFTRTFARANVPLKYSEGYHPAPLISSGPALGVGMESMEEFLDFETILAIPPDNLLIQLNSQLPEDLRFTSIKKIVRSADSLFKIIDAAEYSISLESKELNQEIRNRFNGRHDSRLIKIHESLVSRFLEQETIEMIQIRKGHKKTKNIRPLIKKIEVRNTQTPLYLRLLLSVGNDGSVRPEVILEKIYQLSPEFFNIRREKLWVEREGKLISPLE